MTASTDRGTRRLDATAAAQPGRPLLDRIEAALAFYAFKLWTELLGALALVGQCGAGAGCLPPSPPDVDGRVGEDRRPGAAAPERLPDDIQ